MHASDHTAEGEVTIFIGLLIFAIGRLGKADDKDGFIKPSRTTRVLTAGGWMVGQSFFCRGLARLSADSALPVTAP
jgi:hypothetical protein